MVKIVFAVLTFGVFVLALALTPWPDITPGVNALSAVIQYTYSFNTVFPIDTAWQIMIMILTIEVGMFTFKLAGKTWGAITGHTPITDNAPVGSGGYGDAGYGGAKKGTRGL